MTSNALAAVVYLQQHSTRSNDIFELERHDRALDEIVDNLDRDAPAAFQHRSAIANGAKVIRHRRTVRSYGSLDKPLPDGGRVDVGAIDERYVVVEILDWLEKTPALSAAERSLLKDLARGEDAETLSARHRVPVTSMRQRISRARSAGRSAYVNEVSEC